MIVETSANELFFVVEPADEHLAHCWNGLRVKRSEGGYARVKNAKPILVRKAGCRVVDSSPQLLLPRHAA
jgi:hypothetical protein